jgi:putative ABC transport system permease protein
MTGAELKDGLLLAVDALRSNKFRTFLTILGVLIGVWSVIAMSSLIKGLDNAVQDSISDLGSNILFVTKYPPNTDFEDLSDEERNCRPITIDEAYAILAGCPSVMAVTPEDFYFAPGGNAVKYKNRKANQPRLVGVWPEYEQVRNVTLSEGRFLNRLDDQMRAMVCIIGHDVKKALFDEEDAVGQSIRINNAKFTVIGVVDDKKSMFDDNRNNLVIIPFETFMKLHPWEKELLLTVSIRGTELIDKAREEMTAALRRERKVPYNAENDFAIFGQENIREMIGNITKYIYIAMIVISSVGLMVGGVGVMNIMLVSVTERTREIGVRKAIGARKINILWQFLIEAMTLSGLGGVAGVAAGLGTALLIGVLTPLPFGVSPLFLSLGLVVAISVGLIAGMYPAYQAARVDPIESLRYE